MPFARELSMQPAAVRKRLQRERERLTSVPPVTPVTPAAPVTPWAASSPAPVTPVTPVTVTPVTPVTPVTVTPVTVTPVTLLETEVVKGDGAQAYAATLAIGADDDGDGGIPLVDEPPAPPKPPETTSPAQAHFIARIVTGYVGFGWGALAAQNRDALVAIAETFLRGTPELDALTADQKIAIGMKLGLDLVHESAKEIAMKYNIRIPYQHEAIVGVAVGTATFGVVNVFKGPRNDIERARDARDANPPAPPTQPRDMSPDVTPADAELEGTEGEPTVRAYGRGAVAA